MSEIVYRNTAIHYLSMGSGKQILIALHGYGDNAALYKVLLPSLGNRYTIYAIDLPYHGRTRWAADGSGRVFELAQRPPRARAYRGDFGQLGPAGAD